VKIRRHVAELLRIFDFQNGSCPPSWIWYDVIADNPWLCLMVLTSSCNCTFIVFIFCMILRFLYLACLASNCLFTPHFGEFWGYYPKWIPILSQPQKGPSLAKTHCMSHNMWKSTHGFNLGACVRKRIQYNQLGKKSQNLLFHLSGEKPPLNGMKRIFALV